MKRKEVIKELIRKREHASKALFDMTNEHSITKPMDLKELHKTTENCSTCAFERGTIVAYNDAIKLLEKHN